MFGRRRPEFCSLLAEFIVYSRTYSHPPSVYVGSLHAGPSSALGCRIRIQICIRAPLGK